MQSKVLCRFNQFFVNIGPVLASDIPKSNSDNDFTQYLSNMSDTNYLYMEPLTEEEIIQLVNNAKSRKSKGHDDLDMCLVKKIHIVTPLQHIFNTSLQKGIFPDSMKKARVIPLFKSGDVKEFSNYRPVSLLPQFLERVFHKRLMYFLDKNNVLYRSQYGFRKNMSTSLAILELVEEITNAIDDRKSTVGVFIDLKKAFETVDHNILIKKLKHYGIRGLANKWVSSYLENRNQYVFISDADSECMKISCGVPQGSILGPSLFIL